jgi:hypothetical protein
MNPLILMGMFFGAGLIFIAVFIAIAAKFGTGDGSGRVGDPDKSPPDLPRHSGFD